MKVTLFSTVAAWLFCLGSFLLVPTLMAQPPGSWSGGQGGRAMATGRFYGKVVDENGKGLGYATVELYGNKMDSTTRRPVETLLTGQITADNGDFSLEQVPVRGTLMIKVSFLGYASLTQEVGFAEGSRDFDRDLGNIVLAPDAAVLEQVVVTGQATSVALALDKKVYRVDQNAVAAGGTAEDALGVIPSLSVGVDGGVTLRNSSPQIFVDGRPTTLSLNQIAADAIESVEIITNPSAKYDASGGQGGIVNIILKKDRQIGFNGSVRGGADTRGGLNGGLDLNARENKINLFLNLNYFGRQGFSISETERQNLFGQPLTNVSQRNDGLSSGYFASARGGFDWFWDNRNTLTVNGSYFRGQFDSNDDLRINTDSLFSTGTVSSLALRDADQQRGFRNLSGAVLYKHLFPRQGEELTADVNISHLTRDGDSQFVTDFVGSGRSSRERQVNSGESDFSTFQLDYVNPISKSVKLETGVRAALRGFTNDNLSSLYDPQTDDFVRIPNFADRYEFQDAVYAAYVSVNHQFAKWGYMAGLRAESSEYTGTLLNETTTFENDYPLSLFPSLFLTYKLNDQDNVQASYTRRINRPSFFQLLPVTDFSDSLNIERGNPDLLPEFTDAAELSYQNIFGGGDNLLVSLYYNRATDLITRYQFSELNEVLAREVVVSSFANSNSSLAYGTEITLRNTLGKAFEFTTNLNLYNSEVDASNLEGNLRVSQFSWFLKENISFPLPGGLVMQLTGEYRSRAAFTPAGSDSGRGWGGGPTNTAQGYTLANWFVDAALRANLFKRKLSLTLSMRDIFRTRRTGTFTESPFFIQDTYRLRNPQVARVNLFYRFGKTDSSLFKRRNTRSSADGMDMMQ